LIDKKLHFIKFKNLKKLIIGIHKENCTKLRDLVTSNLGKNLSKEKELIIKKLLSFKDIN